MNVSVFFVVVAILWAYLLLKGSAPRAKLRQAVFEHLTVVTRCGLPVGPGLRALADESVRFIRSSPPSL